MLSGPITHRDTGQQLLAAAWPRGCPMIDNLLSIQILVFVPPNPSPSCVCAGGVQYGLYLRCCCCLQHHRGTALPSQASRASVAPVFTIYIFAGSCVLAGPMGSWLGTPDMAYKCIIIQEKNS